MVRYRSRDTECLQAFSDGSRSVLGKDAAQIISRINGFTFVETQYDYKEAKLNVVYEKAYSEGLRAGTEEEPANCASECIRPNVSVNP